MRAGLRRLALTIAALTAIGALSLESYLPHTDDGCAVETHCIVCAAHLGTAAVPDVHVPVAACLHIVGYVAPDLVATVLNPTVPSSASRGPPLA
jgi:hypothetical protein